MRSESPAESGSLDAGDRAMRHYCERLRSLAGDLLAANPDPAIRRRSAELRTRIASLMAAHHREEESLVFPALLESMAGSDPVCLRELSEFLTAEHRVLEDAWESVRQTLEAAEAGSPGADLEALRAFVERYLGHIEREEQELFPMVARLLSEDEIAKLGQNLHARGSGDR